MNWSVGPLILLALITPKSIASSTLQEIEAELLLHRPLIFTINCDCRVERFIRADDGSIVAAVGANKAVVFDSHKGTILLRIEDSSPIQTLSLDLTNNRVIIGNSRGQISIWDLRSARNTAILQNMDQLLAVSHDGGVFVTGDGKHAVARTDRGEVQATLDVEGLTAAEFSDDDHFLATLTGGTDGYIWDTRVWKLIEIIKMPTGAKIDALFMQSREINILSLQNGFSWGVAPWEYVTGAKPYEWSVPERFVNAKTPSMSLLRHSGPSIAWAIGNRLNLGTWDSSQGVLIHDSSITDFDIDYGQVVTTVGDSRALLWSFDSRFLIARLDHPAPVDRVAFCRRGNVVVTAGKDGVIRGWDINNQGLVLRIGELSPPIILGAGRTMFAASKDKLLRIDIQSGEKLPFINHGSAISAIAVGKHGRVVATGSEDGILRIWDLKSGRQLRGGVHSGCVRSLNFSPDGRFISSGDKWHPTMNGDGCRQPRIEVRDLRTGRVVNTVANQFEGVFSPDGKFLVTKDTEKAGARIWRTSDWRQVGHIETPDFVGLRFPLGDLIFVGDRGDRLVTVAQKACVWRLASAKQVRCFLNTWKTTWFGLCSTNEVRTVDTYRCLPPGEGGAEYTAEIISAAISRDETLLATCDTYFGCHVWDFGTGRLIFRILVTGPISGVSFSTDGRTLVTKSANGFTALWSADKGEQLALFPQQSKVFSDVLFTDHERFRIWDNSDIQFLTTSRGRALRALCREDLSNMPPSDWSSLFGEQSLQDVCGTAHQDIEHH